MKTIYRIVTSKWFWLTLISIQVPVIINSIVRNDGFDLVILINIGAIAWILMMWKLQKRALHED